VYRPQLDFAAEQHLGDARRLLIEPARDALLEYIEMLGQHDT
jgi:hypothetical protein